MSFPAFGIHHTAERRQNGVLRDPTRLATAEKTHRASLYGRGQKGSSNASPPGAREPRDLSAESASGSVHLASADGETGTPPERQVTRGPTRRARRLAPPGLRRSSDAPSASASSGDGGRPARLAPPHALGGRPLHEPLELRRRVLAREVDVPLAGGLVAAERLVLPDAVVRVRAVEVGSRNGTDSVASPFHSGVTPGHTVSSVASVARATSPRARGRRRRPRERRRHGPRGLVSP